MSESELMVPWGYGRTLKSLAEVRSRLEEHYHPEYIERLCAWLMSKNGRIGIGGTWRADGTQPDKPGFAPEGTSFHQNQKYSDGFIGAVAVDLVARNGSQIHRAPMWSEVPVQGSDEAKLWGLHCNVGSPPGGESWHMQPIEIDGHASWLRNGSPAPVPGYHFPGRYTDEVIVSKLTFQKKRLLDTRKLGDRTVQGQVIELSAPEGALAVKLNLTATDTTGGGFIAAYPYGTFRPVTSDLNWWAAGQTIANQIDVPVNSGKFNLFVLSPTHVVVDQVGYWT